MTAADPRPSLPFDQLPPRPSTRRQQGIGPLGWPQVQATAWAVRLAQSHPDAAQLREAAPDLGDCLPTLHAGKLRGRSATLAALALAWALAVRERADSAAWQRLTPPVSCDLIGALVCVLALPGVEVGA